MKTIKIGRKSWDLWNSWKCLVFLFLHYPTHILNPSKAFVSTRPQRDAEVFPKSKGYFDDP
jgi:hypothetical protein